MRRLPLAVFILLAAFTPSLAAGQPASPAQKAPPAPFEEGVPAYLRIAVENVSCGEVSQALPRANAEAVARGRTPVMSSDAVRWCGEALEVMKAAFTLKQWATAYEAIYGFHAKAGLVPALDPKALARRAAQFQQELAQTAKEAAAPANMPMPQVAKRAALGGMPVAFWFAPEFRDRLPKERARIAEDAGSVDSWGRLEAFADQLLWLAAFIREPGVSAATRPAMAPLFAAAKKGQFFEKAGDWQRLEATPSPALQVIARKARGIAAIEIAGKADAKTKTRDWAGAAALMKQAIALAPDDPRLGARRQLIFGKIATEREALLGQIKGARGAKDALAAFKKIDALDAATDGPGAAIPKEMKTKIAMTLEAAAAGKQAEVAVTLPTLKAGNVDYTIEAVTLLKAAGRAAVIARANEARMAKEYAKAEKTLVDAAPLYPVDKEIADLLAAIKADASAGRLDRFEAFFRDGSVAAGYYAVRSDTGLVEAERGALLVKHQAEIQALRASLPIRGRITADNPFGKRLAASAVTGGAWWAFKPEGDAATTGASSAGSPATVGATVASPTIDAALVMASAPDLQPKLVKTEKAAAKSAAPQQQAPNPARQRCDNDYLAKQARIQQMEAQAKAPPAQPKCAPQQGGADAWAGFGGEAVCTPPPPPPTPQVIAAEKQALYSLGQQCAATPPWITQAAAGQSYDIEYWAIAPVAAIELRFSDAARGGTPLGKETLNETVKHEGRSIKPVPQLGVAGEALMLPPAEQVEGQLAAALVPKLKAALERAARSYWQALDAAAKAGSGPQRCEGFARLLLFEEITAEKLPGHAAWDAEVRQCTAGPAKGK